MSEKTIIWIVICAVPLALIALVGVASLAAMFLRRMAPILTALVAATEALNRREAKATAAIDKVQAAAAGTADAIQTAAKVAANVALGTKDEIKQTIRDEIHSKGSESHY